MSDEDGGNLPSYFYRDTKKRRRKSMKQEDRLAKELGGRRQAASGALPGRRGDVDVPELLIECKRTDKKSIRIEIEYLRKITEEASGTGKVPALSIEIGDPPRFVSRDWVLVPSGFLKDLLEAARGTDA